MTIMQVVVICSVKMFLFLARTNYNTVLLSFNWKSVLWFSAEYFVEIFTVHSHGELQFKHHPLLSLSHS